MLFVMKLAFHLTRLVVILALAIGLTASTLACIWDGETLSTEKKRSPDMAQLILGSAPAPPDPGPLRARITQLKANPRETEANWWNDLAGAHLRLGQAREAAELLAPVAAKFPNDYGIHANLGTAYHLLGRYAEAEKEIARDLEINPDAHFGLEKYHLALLQYLVRDSEFQKTNVYVHEWSSLFMEEPITPFTFRHAPILPAAVSGETNRPAYLEKWDLASDTKFEEGVRYMASLNPREPACFVMLGIACLYKRNYNLGGLAFEHAIKLGSPQAAQLKLWVGSIERHVGESLRERFFQRWLWLILPLPIVGWVIARLVWSRVQKRKLMSPH